MYSDGTAKQSLPKAPAAGADRAVADGLPVPGGTPAAPRAAAPELPAAPDGQIDIREQSPLALAFVGDAVLSLLVRARLAGSARRPVHALHAAANGYVSAHAQSLELTVLEPLLSAEETAVLRRGRNASKATVARHASAQEYRASTGLECLLGWLYLQGRTARIDELFDALWAHYAP